MALHRRSAAILLMLAFMTPVVECARVNVKNHFSGLRTSGGQLVASQIWKYCGNLVPPGFRDIVDIAQGLHQLANPNAHEYNTRYCQKSWRLVKVGKDGESWTAGPLDWSPYSFLPKNSGTYGTIFGVFDNTLLIKEQDEWDLGAKTDYDLGFGPTNVSFQFATMDGKKKDAMISVDGLPKIPGDWKWSQFGVNGAELVVHINGYPYPDPPNDNENMTVYTMSKNDGGMSLSKVATLVIDSMTGRDLHPIATADERHAYVFVPERQTLYEIPKVPSTSKAVLTPSAKRIKNFAVEYMFAKPGSTSTSLLIIGGPGEEQSNGDIFFTNVNLAVYEATSENLDKPETWKLHISPFDEKVEEGFSETNLPENMSWAAPYHARARGDPSLCVAYDADNQHLYLGCGPITVLDLSPATWKVLKQMKLPVESGFKKRQQINSIAWVK